MCFGIISNLPIPFQNSTIPIDAKSICSLGLLTFYSFIFVGGNPGYIAANVLNSEPRVSKFELQLLSYVHFWTNALGERYQPT